MILIRKLKYLARNHHHCYSSTTNITCTGLGLNSAFHSEKLATNCLSRGMVHTVGTALAASARGERVWDVNDGRRWVRTS
jgi:hypothetical protein